MESLCRNAKKIIKKSGLPENAFEAIDNASKPVLAEHGPIVSGVFLISASLRPLREGENRSRLIRTAKAAAAKEPYEINEKIQLLTTQLMKS